MLTAKKAFVLRKNGLNLKQIAIRIGRSEGEVSKLLRMPFLQDLDSSQRK